MQSFIQQKSPKLHETASELPIVLEGLLGSVLQQPDSGTVAKQQKKKAIGMHNGTQELTLHI